MCTTDNENVGLSPMILLPKMNFRLKTLMYFTFFVGSLLAIYASFARPVALTPGMARQKVLLAMESVGAYDLIKNKDTHVIVRIPAQDPSVWNGFPTCLKPYKIEKNSDGSRHKTIAKIKDLRSTGRIVATVDESPVLESNRREFVILNERENNKYWLVPYVGTIELHFENDKLEKMIKWQGGNDVHLNKITLKKMNGEHLSHWELHFGLKTGQGIRGHSTF